MRCWFLAITLALTACGSAPNQPTVLAAASLGGVIEQVDPAVRCSYSASSTAARQVAAGAPADLLIVADERWLAQAGDRLGPAHVIAGNRLVVIVPAGAPTAIPDEGPALGTRLAIGDPSHVPAGRYAEQALRSMGWWDRVDDNVIPAADARAALRLVASGEAQLGIVYASDAAAEPGVAISMPISPQAHDPIRYHAAVIDGSARGQALLDALRGAAGRAALERAGLQPMLASDVEP